MCGYITVADGRKFVRCVEQQAVVAGVFLVYFYTHSVYSVDCGGGIWDTQSEIRTRECITNVSTHTHTHMHMQVRQYLHVQQKCFYSGARTQVYIYEGLHRRRSMVWL